jgi:hypothetical protein
LNALFLVATLLATEKSVVTQLANKKILVATQLATELRESRCKSDGLGLY